MSDEKRFAIEAARKARVEALRTRMSAELAGVTGVVLEIGCGHGHFLAAYSAAHPAVFCLGLDLISKRIERALRKRDRANLANLTFIKADAFELLEALPDKTQLQAIFLIFPDPWPKMRHHKNRLIQPGLLDRLAELSTPEHTRLHFRTDHDGYFSWAHSLLAQHPAWHLLPEEIWPFEHETFFSQRLPIHHSLIAKRQERASLLQTPADSPAK
ncbi:MAG: tRNA (guanosine(46)-N7)-methyltransferase TrmB [Puniceicoccales bacterium]|jgi:tRNA (guanine-N7-)-methyltransferase|nr:tRNA (guanosine(46)-N7)-methyltransferase TrmB [Puniceicoccales bacterium]